MSMQASKIFTNKSIIQQVEDKENKMANRNVVPATTINTNVLKRSKTTDPSRIPLRQKDASST